MQEKYVPSKVEEKWQKQWVKANTFKVDVDTNKPKFYMLEMLPYPSGRIHIGHVRNYSIGDAYAWYKRFNGFNVLHPIGWDAFGMPAENAAIKNKMRPDDWTLSNIATMRSQLQRLGFSYDWSREIASCLPDFYRWNQWFFIQLFKKGLIYRKKATVNWCRECQTSLANEQAESGFCWRHEDTPVEHRELEQWFVNLTKYNEELLAGIDGILHGKWPEKVLTMQRNWIGRSEGAYIDFPLATDPKTKIQIFTTRIDTIYGASACVLAPEHPLVQQLINVSPNADSIKEFVNKIGKISIAERITGTLEKEGVDTGIFVVNPFNEEKIPVWIANFVLASYGTGAIMSVPAHDARDYEFALKYKLPIKVVIWPNIDVDVADTLHCSEMPMTNLGLIGPMCGGFAGLTSEQAQQSMAEYAVVSGFGKAAVSYRIRDWGVSRQRSWGTPIPMIHCSKCGIVPVNESNLPIKLPTNLDFSVGAPLTHCREYVETTCPQCGNQAHRDTDTMDTFVDSNWYYFRYCDPKNEQLPYDPEIIKYWMPVDFYIGGVEHAVMHLIYTRVWSMMMRDLGLTDFGEPIKSLLTQGMVILNGAKMSKNKGNVVDPDEMVERYGADATRLSILFAAPPEKEVDWKQIRDEQGNFDYPAAEGALRYLTRVWRLVYKWHEKLQKLTSTESIDANDQHKQLRKVVHQMIKRVTDAYEDGLRLNVTVAACMELTNNIYDYDLGISNFQQATYTDCWVIKEALETLTIMLAPLTPHIAEELWQILGHSSSIVCAQWPQYDALLAKEDKIEIPIQINGKIRSKILVEATASDDVLKSSALADPKVQETIAGKSIVKIIVISKRLVNIVIN